MGFLGSARWCMLRVPPGFPREVGPDFFFFIPQSTRHPSLTRSRMKGDKTTVLALIAAAVILAVVGIKSFLDYKVAELEKIHGNGNQAAQAPDPAAENPAPSPGPAEAGNPGSTPPLPPSGEISQVTGAEDATGEFPAGSIDRLPRSVLPPIPAALQGNDDTGEPAGGANTTAGAAPEDDPRMQAELDALRRENALFQEKLNRIRSGEGGDGESGPIPPPPIPRAGSALDAVMAEAGDPGPGPGSLGATDPATGGTPPPFGPVGGANPTDAAVGISTGGSSEGDTAAAPTPQQTEAEIAALAEQVKRQPALAKVIDYDPEWAILVINSGAESNIAPEMRLAVRRGGEIVGFIKVTEVEQNQSIAELMSRNKYSPTARKPKPGDDVIAFNLF